MAYRAGVRAEIRVPGSICNKLLKQVFAVAKSRSIYDDNYRSFLAGN